MMYLLERKDGAQFNIGQGKFFTDTPEGLLVEVTDSTVVMVKDWTKDEMFERAGRGSICCHDAEWRIYPDGEYCL